MKKKVSILLSVLLVLSFVLVACGSKGLASAYEGTTWKLTSGKDATGIEVTADQLAAFGMSDFSFEFKADGVVTATVAGESADGTFTEKENEITMGVDGDTLTATVDGDTMTVVETDITLIFTKQ
jgi:hypothetical protein